MPAGENVKESADLKREIEHRADGNNTLEEFYYNEGKKEGLMFAKPSASGEILYVALQYKTAREQGGGPHDIGAGEQGIGEYLLAVLHDLDDPNLLSRDGLPGPMIEVWEQGWKDGVVEFYGEVKEKMFDPV